MVGVARKRKSPFKIQIFENSQDKHPARVETRKKESEAQEFAKREYRRKPWRRIIVIDDNGDVCWYSGYASSMPVDRPKH